MVVYCHGSKCILVVKGELPKTSSRLTSTSLSGLRKAPLTYKLSAGLDGTKGRKPILGLLHVLKVAQVFQIWASI
jgi:hypothetical protein